MAQATVLLVLPDEEEFSPCLPALQDAGFETSILNDPDKLSDITAEEAPDVVVLAWDPRASTSPGDAIATCRAMEVAMLVVLAREALPDYDYTKGGDDFLLLPIDQGELAARLRSLLWRVRGIDSAHAIQRGDLVIDQERYEVTLNKRRIFLTFKEYQLLAVLAGNPGRVYTRETLLSRVWGYDYFGGTRTVDVHIRRLRSKIEVSGHTFIETVRNVGYRFKPE